jgi:hypothetical protein
MSVHDQSGIKRKRGSSSVWTEHRENGAHLLAVDLDGFGIDQDESGDRRDRTLVDPGVHGAALDDNVANLQVYDLTAVEFEVNFTRQHHHVVHGFGSVRESRMAGGPLVDPERRAPTVAHIIAVLDETRPLGGVSGRRVVDWH